MMKPALHGVPALVLAALLTFAPASLAQDGPLLPGLEPSDPAPTIEEVEPTPSPAEAPLPVDEAPLPIAEQSLPIDDSITPLDENGRPMNGPESDGAVTEGTLRLPAPPPPPRAPAPLNSPVGPSLLLEGESPVGNSAHDRLEAEPQKRNLWQRSTDALRDITQPKSKTPSPAEQDAARQWQLLRQRELEKLKRQQGQVQQRQLQQREMQQRELQKRQFEQRQLQQRKAAPQQGAWNPRTRVQGAQPQQRAVTSPGVEARAKSPTATPQASSRRQPQRFNSPQPNYPPGMQAVPPSARSRQASQPREVKNEPRSPWERS